ncbi:hypothetical protein SLS62_000893 [Diatrype stigma]|uniref:Flavin-containing monooxygenase n=1 Tax=Diatrype stigma TaxID=117547 RepID=A0AAN9V1U9_9PEZI
MAPKYAGEGGSNFQYNEEQKKRFSENPDEYLEYRKAYVTNEMKRKLQKTPELAKKIIPTTFPVGCRRPNPGHGYLEALSGDKSDVVFSKIAEITEEGVVYEDGTAQKLDVLICGTGFDTSFRPKFPFVGKDGVDLRDVFEVVPDTYLSTMVPDFPNYFMLLGPFAPYGHGSVIPAIEILTRNIAMCLQKFQTQNIKTMAPKKEAMADFREHRDLFMKKTVFVSPCTSWYKLGPKGETVLMWPGSRLHSVDILMNPRWEVGEQNEPLPPFCTLGKALIKLQDYDWEYLMGNRFSYWGNGFSTMDVEKDVDKAWYIEAV